MMTTPTPSGTQPGWEFSCACLLALASSTWPAHFFLPFSTRALWAFLCSTCCLLSPSIGSHNPSSLSSSSNPSLPSHGSMVISSGARSQGGSGVTGTGPGTLYSVGTGASPSPCWGFRCGLLGAVSGVSPATIVDGSAEGAGGGGALGTTGTCSWLSPSFLSLLLCHDSSLPLSDIEGDASLLWVTCIRRVSASRRALFSLSKSA
jgi:hypothetical protein